MEQPIQGIDKEAGQIVRDIGIPPCPAILTNLLKQMREDEPGYNKASKLIGTDAGLAVAMLKFETRTFWPNTRDKPGIMAAGRSWVQGGTPWNPPQPLDRLSDQFVVSLRPLSLALPYIPVRNRS